MWPPLENDADDDDEKEEGLEILKQKHYPVAHASKKLDHALFAGLAKWRVRM